MKMIAPTKLDEQSLVFHDPMSMSEDLLSKGFEDDVDALLLSMKRPEAVEQVACPVPSSSSSAVWKTMPFAGLMELRRILDCDVPTS